MTHVISQIAIIFISILIGCFCRKGGIITEGGSSTLSNIVMKITLPASLFSAIVSADNSLSSADVANAFLFSILMFLLSGLVAVLFVRFFKIGKEDKGVYMFELMCGNVTYIGIPVCVAVLGSNAAFYASVLNIPYNLICFSLGIYFLAGQFKLKQIINPGLVAGVAGTIIYISHIPVPAFILSLASFLGQATTPCAMLIVGSALADVPFHGLFQDKKIFPYIFLRLFGIGIIVALLLYIVDINSTLKGVLVLMASMPAATNSTMLCSIYGGNRQLSAKLILISTLLSSVTILMWSALYFKI